MKRNTHAGLNMPGGIMPNFSEQEMIKDLREIKAGTISSIKQTIDIDKQIIMQVKKALADGRLISKKQAEEVIATLKAVIGKNKQELLRNKLEYMDM